VRPRRPPLRRHPRGGRHPDKLRRQAFGGELIHLGVGGEPGHLGGVLEDLEGVSRVVEVRQNEGAEEPASRVRLLTRNQDGLEGARRDVKSLGGEALVAPTDVTGAEQVEAAAQRVEKEFRYIDVWINDARTTVFSPAPEAALSAWPTTATEASPSRPSSGSSMRQVVSSSSST
jgi:short chain dehydrogenase